MNSKVCDLKSVQLNMDDERPFFDESMCLCVCDFVAQISFFQLSFVVCGSSWFVGAACAHS